MKIIKEESLTNFEFWSGAKDNVRELTIEELEQIEEVLIDTYPEGMEETQINDLFWFDFGYVCKLIGLEYDEDNAKIIR